MCYGLSIRKVYHTLEDFRSDVASGTTLYFDEDRDPLARDLNHILQHRPNLLTDIRDEDTIVDYLQKELPFLSNYELKRRAFELVSYASSEGVTTKQTPIRPGDLIMVRLHNASYIY